eukprot:288493-Rhodomonas_salina.2
MAVVTYIVNRSTCYTARPQNAFRPPAPRSAEGAVSAGTPARSVLTPGTTSSSTSSTCSTSGIFGALNQRGGTVCLYPVAAAQAESLGLRRHFQAENAFLNSLQLIYDFW